MRIAQGQVIRRGQACDAAADNGHRLGLVNEIIVDVLVVKVLGVLIGMVFRRLGQVVDVVWRGRGIPGGSSVGGPEAGGGGAERQRARGKRAERAELAESAASKR